MDDDGVNREGLDYRAGWIEGLQALRVRIRLEGVRVRKGEGAGLETASGLAALMRQDMLGKMKGEAAEALAAKLKSLAPKKEDE